MHACDESCMIEDRKIKTCIFQKPKIQWKPNDVFNIGKIIINWCILLNIYRVVYSAILIFISQKKIITILILLINAIIYK